MPALNFAQELLQGLGERYGFRTTSTYRTPQYNEKIGGVANSQHITGTARDYSIKGKTSGQISGFLGELRENGFEAFVHQVKGGEKHIHAELPSAPAESGCPSWIPSSLCSGYKNISRFGNLISPSGIAGALGDAAENEMNNWLGWITRSALFGIALILIAIALVYAFKDDIAKAALPALKAVT